MLSAQSSQVSLAGKWCQRCMEVNTLRPQDAPPFSCLVRTGYSSPRSDGTVTCLCCKLVGTSERCNAKTVEQVVSDRERAGHRVIAGPRRALTTPETSNEDSTVIEETDEAEEGDTSSLSEYQDEGSDEEYALPSGNGRVRRRAIRAISIESDRTESRQRKTPTKHRGNGHGSDHTPSNASVPAPRRSGQEGRDDSAMRASINRMRNSNRPTESRPSWSNRQEVTENDESCHALDASSAERQYRHSKRSSSNLPNQRGERNHHRSSVGSTSSQTTREEREQKEAVIALQKDVLATIKEQLAMEKALLANLTS